ncbi:lytic transglycosylase domain-containing protein [Phorcysia thermohydrogeniphila]|uniref:Transglycosylase-like protein with SLT domain n=1 Tax=Phorcysia thermohydrogeniphila TaxID=936138 RepID=A0A4R1GDD7_9BACT|nr:lytic transglycosylase domain-containing protein [Phorcysia thermohydrogeniphila]TCK06327.1 transglycosylase-like protein with SLT domain [Phorcysia thermohydrogeniphila]
MDRLKVLTLCISLISSFAHPAYGWIKVYTKNGTIYIVGEGEKRFKKPKEDKLRKIKEKVRYYARKYGIPEELFLNLVKAESNFNPKAVSPKGAMGLCQLMPQTAKELGVKDPFNIDENLNAGAKYLKRLYWKYKDWKLAIAAYNAGAGTVDKYGGIPPYRETLSYVEKVTAGRTGFNTRKKRYRIVVKSVGNTVIISQEFE